MSDEYFAKGTKIRLTNGDSAVVEKKLGEGGQGVVYSVTLGGKAYALKWYKPAAIKNQDAFYKNLDYNIGKGAPTADFLWPLYLTERAGGSFGYLMNLREPKYKEFGDFLLGKTHFGSISAVINACLNITHGFRELHRKGFSYQDLNDGNFFIDPTNGDVMICDNDNVAPDKENLGIAGKARYMAPEIVMNKMKPDNKSDRFSLAVTLFRILFLDHPLEGEAVHNAPCLTEKLEAEFYGTKPTFTYDPNDESNRPVRGVDKNVLKFWPLYPKMLQDMFVSAFSKEAMAMEGRDKRKHGSDWLKVFTQLRDMLIACPCGNETFFDPALDSATCISCKKTIPRPSLLFVKDKHNTVRYTVVLFPGKKLYGCHTDDDSEKFGDVRGEVVRNKDNPQIWGIKNYGQETWTTTDLDGTSKQVPNGKALVILKTKSIQFSSDCTATITNPGD